MAFDPFDYPDEEAPTKTVEAFDPFDAPMAPDPKVVGLQLQDTTKPTLDGMNIANRGSSEGTASFGARVKSGVVDDPKLKLKIMADDLMPNDPDRYNKIGYVDNEIVYFKDGKPYRASTRGVGQALKDTAAGFLSSGPSIVLGSAGSLGGPGLSAVGAMAGRGIEKEIAYGMGQEPDPKQDLTDVGLEGFLSYGSDLAGRGVAKYLGDKKVAKIADDVDLSLSVHNTADFNRMMAKDDFGLDMLPHEVTKNPSMRDRFKVAERANPESGQMVQEFAEKRAGQIEDSVDRLSNKLGLPNQPTRKLKGKAYQQAKDVKNRLLQKREDAGAKYYQQASKYNISDDEFMALWESISREFKDVATDTDKGAALRRIEKKFFEGDEPVMNVGKLHNIKTELDKVLAIDADVATDKALKAKIERIQKDLVDTLSESNHLYKRGREEWIRASKPIENFDSSLAGKIANAESPDGVAKAIFGNGGINDTIEAADIRIAKRYFDKETWDGIVKAHLHNAIDSTKGLVQSKGFKFRDSIFGSNKQQKALAAALGEERFNILNGYMKHMDSMRGTFANESGTAFFQKHQESMVDEAVGKTINTIEKAADPLSIPKNIAKNKKEDMWNKYAIEYIDAVLSADPRVALHNLKRLQYTKPGTEKWIASMASGLGLSVTALSEIFERLPAPEDQLGGQAKRQQ